MLEIQERFGSEGYEELRKAAGSVELHITEAFDKESVIGYIAYSYGTERTVVYGLDDGGDIMLCDGLVRSVMLKSVMKGIKRMLFELDDDSCFERLRSLRFVSADSRQCSDLDSFMNGCQSCKNNRKE